MKYINFDKKHFDKCAYIKVGDIFTFVAYKKLKNGLYRLAAGDINSSNFKLINLGNYELNRIEHHNVNFRNGFSEVEYFFKTSIGKIPFDRICEEIPYDDLNKIDTNLLSYYLKKNTYFF